MFEQISRRRFLQAAGLATGGLVLAACTVPVAPAGDGDAGGAEAQQIVYWTFWADRWGEIQGQIVDNFNASQSAIQVEMLVVPWSELTTKLLTAVPAGEAPDFTIMLRDMIIEFAVRGIVLPLGEQIAASERINLDDWFEVAVTEVVWDGIPYALPFESGTYAAWLNTEAAQEAGLDPANPPVTWSEVDVWAEAMTIGDAASGYERIGFFPWVTRVDILGWLAGGRWYDEENRKITAVTDENVAAFEWIQQYAQKYDGEVVERFRQGLDSWNQSLSDSLDMTPADAPFLQNRLGMTFKGSWSMSAKQEYAPNLDYTVWPLPYRDGASQSTINHGSGCVLPLGSPNPDAAFEFGTFMAIEGIVQWVTSAADMASRKDHMDIFPNALPDDEINRARWKTYNDALGYSRHEPKMPVRSFWNQSLTNARDSVIRGLQTPLEALTEAQELTQKELDDVLGM